jgi:hypothetical protein
MGDRLIPASVSVLSILERGSYVVDYDVNYCATCSASWVGWFKLGNGSYVLKDKLVNSAPNQTIHLSKIATRGEAKFIVFYGTDWGNVHSR